MTLTQEQKACNMHTLRHIEKVRNYLNKCVRNLLERGEKHDQTKLESPEVELFTEYTPQLSSLTFGSPEYEECKKKLGPALEHHYANNAHHPENFKNGVNDMSLLTLIEMICDWKAASERHSNGNIRKSLEINCKRYNIDAQLAQILENTVKELF